MSELNLLEDIEYIKTQVDYIEKFQKKLSLKTKESIGFSNLLFGLKEDMSLYKDIEKWLKSYEVLRSHIQSKQELEEEVQKKINNYPKLSFTPPIETKKDLKTFSVWKKIVYLLFPPYRLNYNRKKVKYVKDRIQEFEKAVKEGKSIVYTLERYYMFM